MKEITELWAFLSERDGSEQIMGVKMPSGEELMLIAASLEEVQKMRPLVDAIVAHNKRTVVLKKFSNPQLVGACLPVESITIIERDPPETPPAPAATSITCPTCGKTSYNLNDVFYGYCGNCKEFWGPRQGGNP